VAGFQLTMRRLPSCGSSTRSTPAKSGAGMISTPSVMVMLSVLEVETQLDSASRLARTW
jgi:hypothetical protein